MLLGLGGDLDGLLGQNRLRLIPLHTTEPAEQDQKQPKANPRKEKRKSNDRAAARRRTLRRTSAAPLASSGAPAAAASSSTSDGIPSQQGKNLRDATFVLLLSSMPPFFLLILFIYCNEPFSFLCFSGFITSFI